MARKSDYIQLCSHARAMPFHRCGNNNTTPVLMGSLSTLTACSFLLLPLIDCFNLKITRVIYLFLVYLFHRKGSYRSLTGHTVPISRVAPHLKCRMSLIMAFRSISLFSPSPDTFFTFGSSSQSVIVFFRAVRYVKETDVWHFMWRNVVESKD